MSVPIMPPPFDAAAILLPAAQISEICSPKVSPSVKLAKTSMAEDTSTKSTVASTVRTFTALLILSNATIIAAKPSSTGKTNAEMPKSENIKVCNQVHRFLPGINTIHAHSTATASHIIAETCLDAAAFAAWRAVDFLGLVLAIIQLHSAAYSRRLFFLNHIVKTVDNVRKRA